MSTPNLETGIFVIITADHPVTQPDCTPGSLRPWLLHAGAEVTIARGFWDGKDEESLIAECNDVTTAKNIIDLALSWWGQEAAVLGVRGMYFIIGRGHEVLAEADSITWHIGCPPPDNFTRLGDRTFTINFGGNE